MPILDFGCFLTAHFLTIPIQNLIYKFHYAFKSGRYAPIFYKLLILQLRYAIIGINETGMKNCKTRSDKNG